MSEAIPDLKTYDGFENSHYVFKDSYSFFGKNILKAVGILVGLPNWKNDLPILESYSMPFVACNPNNDAPEFCESIKTKGTKLLQWLAYMKEEKVSNFYINPKWVLPICQMPDTKTGTILNSKGESVPMVSWTDVIAQANTLKGPMKSDDPYFAVCRIHIENEIEVVASLLASTHRPSILYIFWSASPDESQMHCEAAGHVQTCGYRLLSINYGFYMYQYTGQDMYSCCSWTEPSMAHPFVQLMTEQVAGILNPQKEQSPEAPAVEENVSTSKYREN
jgi:hypothetical protein